MARIPLKVSIRKGGRKPSANLSNTYGIKNTSRMNAAAPGSAKGAVTQTRKGGKISVSKAKRKVLG